MVRSSSLLACYLLIIFFDGTSQAHGQDWTHPVLAAGHFRVEAASLHLSSSARFGQNVENGSISEAIEPHGFDFTSLAIGSGLFPILSDLESQMSVLTDYKDYSVNLGTSVTNLTRNEVRIPISVSLGIFDYLTLGATIPITRRRTEVSSVFNGQEANVGISPTITNPQQINTFLSNLASASSELSGIAQTLCTPDTTSSQCLQAQAVLQESQQFRQTLNNSYTGFGVFPLEGSLAGNMLQLELDALSSAYSNLGLNSYPANIPLANQRLTTSHFNSLITDPSFGVSAYPLESWSSPWELGDIELFGNLRLFSNSPQNQSREDVLSSKLHYLLGIGGLVRLGTGQTDLPDNLVDIGSGDGQNDFVLKVFTNLSNINQWGIWAEASYGHQQSTLVTRRVALAHQTFPSLSSTQLVEWTPGVYSQLRLSPRYHLTPELTLLGETRYFTKKLDQYTITPEADCHPSTCLDPGPLEYETQQTLFEIGGGFTFNTTRSQDHPLEIRFLYRTPILGSGGKTAKTSLLELSVQLFRVFSD